MLSALDAASLPDDAVEVGRVLGAWGVKGWFKVMPYSASPEALFSSRRWFIQASERASKGFAGTLRLLIQEAREHSDSIVACAHGVPDRSTAEALRGARIFVPRSSFPTAAPDEYYWVDLLGLDVRNREGLHLGQVHDLMATGPQSVLVLRYEHEGKPSERLIPFVSAYVDRVDVPGRCIHVDWQPDY